MVYWINRISLLLSYNFSVSSDSSSRLQLVRGSCFEPSSNCSEKQMPGSELTY